MGQSGSDYLGKATSVNNNELAKADIVNAKLSPQMITHLEYLGADNHSNHIKK